MPRRRLALLPLLAALTLPAAGARAQPRTQQPNELAPLADRVFAPWRAATAPGCAVGVDRAGRPRFTRAYGAADLELGVANRPGTIFEAGSISKQFTAAAVMLLALDGKLGIDDDVRRYVPELPVYERPITIRHLLTHTSGLRDWGDIVGLAGWPRGSRVHDHDDVLQVLARQRALNYPPGERYSYTNSGYNLLAIIVSRVSGESFASFSRTRLFAPLGLGHTQWRDDYTRLVPGRAQAYAARGDAWRLDMPFENVHGNGGLLTTVDDLLTWTAVLERPTPQWKPLVDSLHVTGRLTSGEPITYAAGLVVDEYRGVRRVQHSGSTAGYRTFVARFPGRGLAIAVLCNAASANPTAYVNELADALLGSALAPAARAATARAATAPSAWAPTPRELTAFAGEYYSPDVDATFRVTVEGDSLRLFRAPATRHALRPRATDAFEAPVGRIWFTRDTAGRVTALHAATSRAYDVVFERR